MTKVDQSLENTQFSDNVLIENEEGLTSDELAKVLGGNLPVDSKLMANIRMILKDTK